MNDHLTITVIPIWNVEVGPHHTIRVSFGLPLHPCLMFRVLFQGDSGTADVVQFPVEVTPPPLGGGAKVRLTYRIKA